MGLIDQTAQLGREIKTQRQQQEEERALRRKEREQKQADSLCEKSTHGKALEELETYFCQIYETLGYAGATLYFKSTESREIALKRLAKDEWGKSNEMLYAFARKEYDKILAKIDKRYKREDEFQQAIQPIAEPAKQSMWDIARACANFILAIFKILWRVVLLLILIIAGFSNLADSLGKNTYRSHSRRSRHW